MMIINGDLEQCRTKQSWPMSKYHIGIWLQWLMKTIKIFSQDS